MYHFFIIYVLLVYNICSLRSSTAETVEYLNRIMVKMKENDVHIVQTELKKLDLRFVEKIIPGIYLFELENQTDQPWRADEGFIQNVTSCCPGKVLEAEQEVESIKPLWTVREPTIQQTGSKTADDDGYVRDAGYPSNSEHIQPTYDENLKDATQLSGRTKCKGVLSEQKLQTYSDMGILAAWSRGYTGKGVVIGVTDVGVDVNHEDLSPNVDHTLAYNAFTGNGDDVAPEHTRTVDIFNYQIADHGTNCASLIAAVKDCFCGVGVAYEAKVAALKAFKIPEKNSIRGNSIRGNIKFSDAYVARCLSHANQSIHIYSNSWSTSTNFDQHHFGMAAQTAVRDGVNKGRGGKGSIFVFPAGGVADGYANSRFTITVNGVGAYGEVPEYSTPCACVLTSAYGEGSTNSSILETASWFRTHPKCTRSFEGTSASVAIVSAITGLALEANNDLTWRDIQHLLVESSTNNSLPGKHAFLTNGAGKPYHPILGFGLLNASRMVQLAKTWKNVPDQKCHSPVIMVNKGCSLSGIKKQKWTCSMDTLLSTDLNIVSVEHVVVKVVYDTQYESRAQLALQSPSGTGSVLKHHGQAGDKATEFRNAKLLSVQFWGESVPGRWRVTLEYPKDDKYPKSSPWQNAAITICGSKRQNSEEAEGFDTTTTPYDTQSNVTQTSVDGSNGEKDTSNNVPWWAIVIIVGLILGTVCTIIVLYIYKKKVCRTRKPPCQPGTPVPRFLERPESPNPAYQGSSQHIDLSNSADIKTSQRTDSTMAHNCGDQKTLQRTESIISHNSVDQKTLQGNESTVSHNSVDQETLHGNDSMMSRNSVDQQSSQQTNFIMSPISVDKETLHRTESVVSHNSVDQTTLRQTDSNVSSIADQEGSQRPDSIERDSFDDQVSIERPKTQGRTRRSSLRSSFRRSVSTNSYDPLNEDIQSQEYLEQTDYTASNKESSEDFKSLKRRGKLRRNSSGRGKSASTEEQQENEAFISNETQ